ncbi:DUF3823 domain-containing protein [Massilibacteroides vaginae]|uniref:DUF3823 domain-containing protein n=1 Tax=Massilibacteroides vaginae TaxID=1673718 RepID=UPI000A1C9E37|nr:DUF3823 domain-containing protein [Massilibacteroides vaginae]
MKTKFINIIVLIFITLTSCEYDDFDQPKAMLTGKVVFQGNPVGVRTNGPQLELWESGHALYTKIPVYIAHDGSYSAALFNGKYKLVRLSGAPWEPQSNDTVIIDVKGNTIKDIEVIPYLIVRNESFQKNSSGNISAKFIVDKIVQESNLAEVRLFLGKNILTDQNKHEYVVNADVESIILGQEFEMIAVLPKEISSTDYLFVRIGVRSNKSSEFYYTQTQKIILN